MGAFNTKTKLKGQTDRCAENKSMAVARRPWIGATDGFLAVKQTVVCCGRW
jgi:hypothetical protein